MRDYITIGSAPAEEECVNVSRDGGYLPAMMAECKRFRDLIRETLGEEPGSARLAVKTFPHEFGSYAEVVCYYDDEDEAAEEYAFRCESEAPIRWKTDGAPRHADGTEVSFAGILEDETREKHTHAD